MPSGGGKSTTVSKQELGPEQRQLLNLAMPMAKEYASKPLEMFPGSTIVGPTDTQLAARGTLAETAQGPVQDLSNKSIGVAKDFMSGGRAGLSGGLDLLSAGRTGMDAVGALLGRFGAGEGSRGFIESGALLDPATNPVLAAQTRAAIDPVARTLTERALPEVRSDFIGGNMFGSSRQGIAERGVIDDFTREAGRIATDLQMNNFNQGLGAMLSSLNTSTGAAQTAASTGLSAGQGGTNAFLNSALQSLSQSPALANLAFLPGMTMEGIGSMQQKEAQAKLTEEADRFTTAQMLPFLQAQDIAGLASGIGGGSATTTGQQNPAFDPFGTALGLFGMAGMAGMGPLSFLFR